MGKLPVTISAPCRQAVPSQAFQTIHLAPLLHSGETPPGVLCPALESSAQEKHRPVGVGPEEVHKNDQRGGAPLL